MAAKRKYESYFRKGEIQFACGCGMERALSFENENLRLYNDEKRYGIYFLCRDCERDEAAEFRIVEIGGLSYESEIELRRLLRVETIKRWGRKLPYPKIPYEYVEAAFEHGVKRENVLGWVLERFAWEPPSYN